jgi:uncharacterized protein (DUF2141 family)
MKQLLYSIIIILVLDALLSNCANPKTPTGGPQDTIPPVMVNAIPANGELNVNTQEIEITFDEWISTEKLSQNLIITPQLDIKYKTLVKKNTLTLKFEEPFPDSTTITFNFFDGITDITEKNPAVNLIYVFSTGSYLDSLSISGKITTLFSQVAVEKMTVGLYRFNDSLDVFKTKPTYFTSSSKEGTYKISNIKNGQYKLVAFKDENRNMLFDASTEMYAFYTGTIQLDSSFNNIDLTAVKINATELRKLSSKANGRYFDIRYSKPIDSISSLTTIPYHLLEDRTTVRYYQPSNYLLGDSIQIIQQVYDSLANNKLDTLFVKFNESVRKPAEFNLVITPQPKSIDVLHTYNLKFSKPIISFDQTLLSWKKDSTYTMYLDSTAQLHWNATRTHLKLIHQFDTTAYYKFQSELLEQTDTAVADTTQISKTRSTTGKITKGITLTIEKGAMISAENDTLKGITQPVTFIQLKQTGTIILNINTEETHYTVQLINKQLQVIKEYEPFRTKKITKLTPGDYGVRILIDTNKDGKWSYGNILKDEEPEKIFLFPDFTSLRANWEVSLDIAF